LNGSRAEFINNASLNLSSAIMGKLSLMTAKVAATPSANTFNTFFRGMNGQFLKNCHGGPIYIGIQAPSLAYSLYLNSKYSPFSIGEK
jgi:hypothetical protein